MVELASGCNKCVLARKGRLLCSGTDAARIGWSRFAWGEKDVSPEPGNRTAGVLPDDSKRGTVSKLLVSATVDCAGRVSWGSRGAEEVWRPWLYLRYDFYFFGVS